MFKSSKPNLMIEITMLLIVKSILIFLIWWLFFSHPPSKTLRQDHIIELILGVKE